MATKRAAKAVSASLDFAFFQFLWQFYQANRGTIRTHYKELTRKFLDFNNPEKNPKVFLRQPQFEALETYVFLKEFLGNAKVEEIFQQWFEKQGRFADRAEGGVVSGSAGQVGLFDKITQDQYKAVFAAMRKNSRAYPNYIFALTMGTGKTILMATCIFYEFLLGNKFEKDARYCHNALVFAPDKTVLQSLKEIESFDMTRVVPPEYVNFLTTHLRFHYLEEAGTSLDTLDRSRFNIIVSNTQKIILKRQHKEKTSVDKLFGATGETLAATGVYADAADLYNFDQPEEEGELTTNQRFEKLRRLEQLGIFVDEAHHAFGKALAKDMGVGAKETDTSLRTTIDILAASLSAAGTRVVACYNYTGTPYVGREVLPEVVYAYGLKEAIDKGFLKKVTLHGYANTRTDEFVNIAIENFLKDSGELRPEGLLAITNEFNELLYDEIIPRLFRQLYDLDESQQTEEHEVDLIKLPPNGYYEVSAAKDKIVRMHDAQIKDEERAKSFHLDTYCFDSGSENWLFWDLLREQRVKKIYFTGMLTHGQSDFFIQYIDPDSRTVRSYYPDFIFQREEPDGSLKYVIVEVKADNQIEDAVVQAKKDFAQQIAVASGMEYRILKSSDADKRHFRSLL